MEGQPQIRPAPPRPRVLIVVLCHNGVALTLQCLGSLTGLSYTSADVLVVDNASSDGTAGSVREQFPMASVIETGGNLGYAAGNNVGLRHALKHDYDYALLLNNDTEVAPDLLDRLVAICEADRSIGVAGPRIYYYDRPTTIWSAGGTIDWRRGISTMRGLDAGDEPAFARAAEVDFVTGCALLVRREALAQVGLIDERFGMYYEEVEWCVRIARAGWKIVYVPEARLWHKISPTAQDWSPRITYYMTRNRLLFLRLARAPLRAWIHALLLQDLRTWLSWSVRRRWRGRKPQRRALGRGWRDFLAGRFGMAW